MYKNHIKINLLADKDVNCKIIYYVYYTQFRSKSWFLLFHVERSPRALLTSINCAHNIYFILIEAKRKIESRMRNTHSLHLIGCLWKEIDFAKSEYPHSLCIDSNLVFIQLTFFSLAGDAMCRAIDRLSSRARPCILTYRLAIEWLTKRLFKI